MSNFIFLIYNFTVENNFIIIVDNINTQFDYIIESLNQFNISSKAASIFYY